MFVVRWNIPHRCYKIASLPLKNSGGLVVSLCNVSKLSYKEMAIEFGAIGVHLSQRIIEYQFENECDAENMLEWINSTKVIEKLRS